MFNKRQTPFRLFFVACVLLAAFAFTAGGPFSAAAVKAQGPPDLEAQHRRLLPLFELAGVVFTDADETTGRLAIGVMDPGVRGLVRARLAALGIAADDVDIVPTDDILPLTTLRDQVRPVQGGLQIRFSGYLCSLSFPASRNGVLGFVTASHCSDRQGSEDGTLYYQPLNQVSDEFVGQEIADPSFFRGNNCPKGKKCRYSDANFSEGASGVNLALGIIAKTTGPNNGSLTLNGSFQITGEASASVRDTANKVGRTTGWTQGPVTRTCVDTGQSGSNVVMLCQDFVESNAQIVGSGDSGSPVFRIDNNGVSLLGTLWGGNSAGTLLVYSPIANIEEELGHLIVH
jgi:hypothetical protein